MTGTPWLQGPAGWWGLTHGPCPCHSSGSCQVSWKRVWRVGPLGRSGPLPGGGDANLDMALSSPPFCPREAPKRLLGGALVQPCLFLEDSPQRHAPPGRLPIAGKPLVCSGGGAPPAPPDPRELCQHRGCCEKEGASEGTRGRPGLPEPSLGPALRQRDGLRLPWPGRRAGPFGSPCRGGGGVHSSTVRLLSPGWPARLLCL